MGLSVIMARTFRFRMICKAGMGGVVEGIPKSNHRAPAPVIAVVASVLPAVAAVMRGG